MRTTLVTTSMKTMLAVGAVCLMGSVLQAQDQAVKAHIPFAFEVSSKVLPEGDYVVTHSAAKPIAEIVNRRTGKRCFVLAGNGNAGSSARRSLVFHRYGETYFLSEIWSGGQSSGTLAPSKREKEIMRSPKGKEMALVSITLLAD